jgi:biotin carboxyl carrier protein
MIASIFPNRRTMKLKAELAAREYALMLRHEDSSVVAEVDGRSYELDIRHLGPNEYLFLERSDVYDCRVEKTPKQPGIFEVRVGTQSYAVRLIDPKRLRSAQSPGTYEHSSVRIVAPMPGKVVRVLVEVGSHVKVGAGIVVVEAMKMQNEMKSPKTGTVVALHAQAGATVNGGDVLAVVE